MKFKLTKASDTTFEKDIEVNSLEELKQLEDKYCKEIEDGLIINFKEKTIQIYDNWVE